MSTIPVLRLFIEASKPVILGIRGTMPNDKHTAYFDRTYTGITGKFKGKKWFEFPLPVVRDGVKVRAYDRAGKFPVSILEEKIIYRQPIGLDVDNDTFEFLHFALDMARNIVDREEGIHQSNSGAFRINVRQEIRSYSTGRLIGTPARVNHETRIMEVSKRDFLPLTLPNRYFILLHEYYHVLAHTKNEFECDRFALTVMLSLGFSKTECLYSLSKLFSHAGSNSEREKRVSRAKDFILVFIKKHPYRDSPTPIQEPETEAAA